MRFDVLTLFPDIFPGYLGQSLLKRAIDAGLVEVRLHDIRDWSQGKHNTVDDRPFGGGPGMVMKVEPVVACVEAVRAMAADPGHLVMLTPQGRRLDQAGGGTSWPGTSGSCCLCGRYEGFDERIRLILEPDEISIGDFVLNGGEVAAMVIIDAVIRLVPGVLGDEDSSAERFVFGPRGDGWNLPNTRGPGSIRGLRSAGGPAERQPRGNRPLARRKQPPADARAADRFAG